MAAMIQLDLTDADEQDLREEVEKRLTEIEIEIVHTDSKDYRNMLKRRRESLLKLLEKLPDVRVA